MKVDNDMDYRETMNNNMTKLIGVIASSVLLLSCTRIPTSTCGAKITPQQCSEQQDKFAEIIAKLCASGKIAKSYEEKIDPNKADILLSYCQRADNGMSSNDIFYDEKADFKCGEVERGLLDESLFEYNHFLLFGWATKTDDLILEAKEEIKAQCNDYRNKRISSRDLLYNEAQAIRRLHHELPSTILSEWWSFTIWPFKAMLALLGIAATIIGIISGIKKLTNE